MRMVKFNGLSANPKLAAIYICAHFHQNSKAPLYQVIDVKYYNRRAPP